MTSGQPMTFSLGTKFWINNNKLPSIEGQINTIFYDNQFWTPSSKYYLRNTAINKIRTVSRPKGTVAWSCSSFFSWVLCVV